MLTDFHCHILPYIDDGSESVEMSLKMLDILREQGVERVVATPHFYAHLEKSVANFLKRRNSSFKKLKKRKMNIDTILLGAEVAVERGICTLSGIEKLAIQGTKLILLELPYTEYADWMLEEIVNISYEYNLIPIIAHINRYCQLYTEQQMENILRADALFQINNEVFLYPYSRKFVKKLIKNGQPIIFGSDSHNIDVRKPNFDIMKKKMKRYNYVIEQSDAVIEKYEL